MLNLFAIGGGEIGTGETLDLDRAFCDASGKGRPRVLFVPTASGDSLEYVEKVRRMYQEGLGCEFETLLLHSEPNQLRFRPKIEWADLVYVGGGNTRRMLELWRVLRVDKALVQAAAEGKALGGLSAGAICWFRHGNSDAPIIEGETDRLTMRVDGLDLLPFSLCPHTKKEEFRLDEFRRMMRTTPGMGVGVDDACALQIRGDQYRVLACAPNRGIHRIEWRNDQMLEDTIEPHSDFRPISDLLAWRQRS